MNTRLHSQFKKAYKNRVKNDVKLTEKVSERVSLFQKNSTNPLLKDHALTGNKSHLRAFAVTGDIRIVYLPVSETEVVFMDIGSHNQVY